jgi:membrane-bound serine protease (ClpP class)
MQVKLLIAFGLIAVGLLLLIAELFLYSGVLFVLAICGLIGGIAMTFVYSEPYVGWLTLLAVFVVVPVLSRLLFRLSRKTAVGKQLFLSTPDADATVAAMPVNVELEQLRGRIGRALSALRPAGVVDFDGRRIDTITEGMMVDPGQWVRCVDVRAGKVVVRPVEKPDLGDLETAVFG